MNAAANTPNLKRILIDVFSFKRWAELHNPGEFYQQLASDLVKGIHTKEVFIETASRLVKLADHAYTLRQMNAVEQISQILLSLPLACEFRNIARYYQGLCVKRKGELDRARALFERVAEAAPIKYRARAMIALGSAAFDSGDFQSVLPLYAEGNRAAACAQAFDPLAAFYTQHMMAVLRSIEGDNRGALADLERMSPLIRSIGSAYPPIYYTYLNSLAVELAESDRLEEAERVCRVTVASPFADVYPEYRATSDDIALRGRRASRSFVSFAQGALKGEKVLHLPAPSFNSGLAEARLENAGQPARVLDYLRWKEEKMVKEPNGDNKKDEEMDARDVFMEIMRLSSQEDMTSKKLWKILEAVRKITKEPNED